MPEVTATLDPLSASATDPAAPAPTPEPGPASPPEPAVPDTAPEPPPPPVKIAVQQCCAAYYQTLAAETDSGACKSEARDKAGVAYRNAMPFLTSRANIRDFIACVAHGMLLRVFWNDEGPKLITAARAAVGALPREPREPQEPREPRLHPHSARPAGRPRSNP